MKSAPRVVLDTNVVLSALLFSQGRLARIRSAWRASTICPLVSRSTVEELMRALQYPKFRLAPEDQREMLADYLPYCATVSMPAKPPRTPPCRDPNDVPFLQFAVVGKAACVVTGDRDLLSLDGRFSCPIVTPGEFAGSLGKV